MTRIIKVKYVNLMGKEVEHEIDPRDTQKFLKCMTDASECGDLGTVFVQCVNLNDEEEKTWVEWSQLL